MRTNTIPALEIPPFSFADIASSQYGATQVAVAVAELLGSVQNDPGQTLYQMMYDAYHEDVDGCVGMWEFCIHAGYVGHIVLSAGKAVTGDSNLLEASEEFAEILRTAMEEDDGLSTLVFDEQVLLDMWIKAWTRTEEKIRKGSPTSPDAAAREGSLLEMTACLTAKVNDRPLSIIAAAIAPGGLHELWRILPEIAFAGHEPHCDRFGKDVDMESACRLFSHALHHRCSNRDIRTPDDLREQLGEMWSDAVARSARSKAAMEELRNETR